MLYPINLELNKMKITVIGGGKVAYRKTVNFLNFKKRVTVISKEFIEEFNFIADKIDMIFDEYKEEYIKDSFIVIVATNNKQLNYKIGVYCNENGKLVNVVDNKEISNFTVPSYLKRGDFLLSISTGGNSPALSTKIKRELEKVYDEDFGEYVKLLGIARKRIIKENKDIEVRRKKIKELIDLSIEEVKEKI